MKEDLDTVSIRAIRSFVKDEIGLDFEFLVLRQARTQELLVERPDLTAVLFRIIIVVEYIEEPHYIPSGLTWVPILDSCEKCVVNVGHSEEDAQRDINRELYGIVNDLSPAQLVPWAFHSWYEKTTGWVQEIFARHDLRMIGRMEQVRTSAHSTVLKVKTNRGYYFIKCSASTSNDAGITSVMSSVAPNLVRKPLVVDIKRRIMILEDHGEDFGIIALSDEQRRHSMRSLARLHKQNMTAFSKLVDVGLLVYTPQRAVNNLDALLDAEELAFMHDSELWESLRAKKGRIFDALLIIADWEMPNCLVHNDVFAGNLTRNVDEAGVDTSYCFFDFDSSFGGHPICDLWWCNRDLLEVYADEMNITDIDGLYEASGTAEQVSPLWNAFRYIERVRAAKEGGVRSDELYRLIGSLRSLTEYMGN